MTSSDAPPPPGGPLRDDQPDGPIQPTGNDHNSLPDPAEDNSADHSPDGGSVPPVHQEPEQPEGAAALQAENAETSMDQPSQ